MEEVTPQGDSDEKANAEPASVESLHNELKDFKAQYTRKTQGFADEKRLWELERKGLEDQLEQLTSVTKNLITDDGLRDEYRKNFGVGQNNITVPELKTPEDLNNFLTDALTQIRQEVLDQARREATQSSSERVDAANRENRWMNAQKTLGSDSMFTDNLDRINYLVETQFAKEYTGSNELEVYEKALNHVKQEADRFKELGKQEALESLKKKKAAATNVPHKSVSTTGQKAGSGKRSAEDIIAAVNARLQSR